MSFTRNFGPTGILLPLCLLFLFLTLSAQGAMPDSTGSSPYHPLDTLWHDVKEGVSDAALLFSRPLHFGTQDWLLTGSTVGGTLLLMTQDELLRTEILKTNGTDGDQVMNVGKEIGGNLNGVIFAGAVYTTGLVFNWPKVRLAGRHIVQALTYSAVVTTALKYGFGRHRPFLEDGAFAFEGPGTHGNQFLSLPSGHTTVAFAIASSLAADIGNPWATAGLYSVATLTAVSRMYHDQHWGSDVFLAAAIASAIGYGTVHLHQPEDADGTSFYVAPTGNGIALGWVW